jgi:hypothetical protein
VYKERVENVGYWERKYEPMMSKVDDDTYITPNECPAISIPLSILTLTTSHY